MARTKCLVCNYAGKKLQRTKGTIREYYSQPVKLSQGGPTKMYYRAFGRGTYAKKRK